MEEEENVDLYMENTMIQLFDPKSEIVSTDFEDITEELAPDFI